MTKITMMVSMLETTRHPTNMNHTIEHYKSNAIEVLPGDLSLGILLMCEHASNHIPVQYNNLGLPSDQLERHIAYDIGAQAVIRRLSASLGVPAILTRYSRLLIDPNRALDDPTLVMQLSDGAVIPGNAYISEQETAHRIETYYKPYHTTLKQLVDRSIGLGKPPILISVHSFTNRWKKISRPWEIGILWDKDPRLPLLFLQALAQTRPAASIGDNEPYSGRLIKDSMYSHATRRGLAHTLIELRQDLIREESGQEKWATILTDIIQNIQAIPKQLELLHSQQNFGSYICPDSPFTA